MTTEEEMTREEREEDLKQYWYNRWKEGFSWLEMASILKTSADTLHNEFNEANKKFLQRVFGDSIVKKVNDGMEFRLERDLLSYHDSKMDFYPIYMSQIGYALENLFKGIIICRMWLSDPKSIDDVGDFKTLRVPIRGSTEPISINTHDLIPLHTAAMISSKFDKNNRIILIKLVDFIKWGGRYPIPLELDTGDPLFMRVIAPYDEPEEHKAIERMYNISKKELETLSREQETQR